MLVRVIDYVANPGGGVRFTVELLSALLDATAASFEVVSSGAALIRYRRLLPRSERIAIRDLAPVNAWRTRPLLSGIPGAGPLNWALRMPCFHFEVPASALRGCDVVWLPWMHRHRLPGQDAGRVVATLHDLIAVEFPGIVRGFQRRDEAETIRGWLSSSSRIVVSSHATVSRLADLFGIGPGRVTVVPLSGSHGRGGQTRSTSLLPFEGRPYVLAAINLTPHKNYEGLLAGFGAWDAPCPLVVTGSQTDLWNQWSLRSLRLRRLAAAAMLVPGDRLFALGYVEDATYYALLDGAWALVMPSLAEGGGSFPVWEALLRGIPVICADTPVMREMVDRIGARVIWFDPRSGTALAGALADLASDYPRIKTEAVAQIETLGRRTWADVASDYARLLRLPLREVGPASG